MIRRWLKALLRVTSAAVITSPLLAQKPVVFVSSAKIFEAAPGWQKAESEFTTGLDSVHATEARLSDSLQAMLAAYRRDEGSLGARARAARRAEIDRRAEKNRARGEALEKSLSARRALAMDSITTRVRSLIAKLRVSRGYGVMLDFDSGGILAADPAYDVTSEVIAALTSTARASPGSR